MNDLTVVKEIFRELIDLLGSKPDGERKYYIVDQFNYHICDVTPAFTLNVWKSRERELRQKLAELGVTLGSRWD